MAGVSADAGASDASGAVGRSLRCEFIGARALSPKIAMLKRTALLAAVVAVCGVAALPRARGGAAATSQRPAPPPSPGMESVPEDFKLPDAMKTLYGNYDPLAHTSTFRLTKTFPHTFFDKPGKVDARAFLTTGAKDTGAMKVFVLTFGVPHGSPEFDCHACAPVIGAAVFAKKDGGAWAVESAKTFCGSDAPGFVNGVLGAVLRELRENQPIS